MDESSASRSVTRRKSVGEAYSPHHNSLNFLRLVLALGVVVAHAVDLGGGFGWDNNLVSYNGLSLGTIAVYGFFGISGYLIAGSASHNGVGRYLWQRVVRIFPGFWVCLVLTPFFFSAIGWISQAHPHCGTYLCYLDIRNGPISYVYRNLFLRIDQTWVVPPPAHQLGLFANGSLWTLYYEFLCYLILGALSLVGFLRHRHLTLITAAGLWLTVIVITLTPAFDSQFNLVSNVSWMSFLQLSPVFMAGAVIYLYRDQIPDSGFLALGCAAAFIGAVLWLPGTATTWTFTHAGLVTPLIAYPMLWLGNHLPFQRIGSKNDYSYGVYIYAYPVTVLLAVWGVQRSGFVPFVLACIAGTAPFAAASWWMIERRALRLKRLDWRRVWLAVTPFPPPRPRAMGAPSGTGSEALDLPG